MRVIPSMPPVTRSQCTATWRTISAKPNVASAKYCVCSLSVGNPTASAVTTPAAAAMTIAASTGSLNDMAASAET